MTSMDVSYETRNERERILNLLIGVCHFSYRKVVVKFKNGRAFVSVCTVTECKDMVYLYRYTH